jgi:hypothetical protein
MLELYIYIWKYHVLDPLIKQKDVCEWLNISSVTYWRYMNILKSNDLIRYESGRGNNSAMVALRNISDWKCSDKITNLKPYELVGRTFAHLYLQNEQTKNIILHHVLQR